MGQFWRIIMWILILTKVTNHVRAGVLPPLAPSSVQKFIHNDGKNDTFSAVTQQLKWTHGTQVNQQEDRKLELVKKSMRDNSYPVHTNTTYYSSKILSHFLKNHIHDDRISISGILKLDTAKIKSNMSTKDTLGNGRFNFLNSYKGPQNTPHILRQLTIDLRSKHLALRIKSVVHQVEGAIDEHVTYEEITSSFIALRSHIQFEIHFPANNCCPFFTTQYREGLQCIDHKLISAATGYEKNILFSLMSGSRQHEESSIHCDLIGDSMICTGEVKVLHYKPKRLYLILGYECSTNTGVPSDGESQISLQGLWYKLRLELWNSTMCEKLDSKNSCSQFFSYAAFPNTAKQTESSAARLLDTIQRVTQNCYDINSTQEAFCHDIYFGCDGPGPQSHFVTPCREMCYDATQACIPQFAGAGSVTCEYYPLTNESDTCIYSKPVCEKPLSIQNGYVKASLTNYTAGSRVQYSCNTGYILKGDEYSECKFTGKWTDPPTCDDKLIIIISSALGGTVLIVILILVTIHILRYKKKLYSN